MIADVNASGTVRGVCQHLVKALPSASDNTGNTEVQGIFKNNFISRASLQSAEKSIRENNNHFNASGTMTGWVCANVWSRSCQVQVGVS